MLKSRFLTSAIMLFITFICAFSIVKIQIEINRLENEKNQIIEYNQILSDDIDMLNQSLNEPKDDEYYEEKAREKLNLRLPEEVVFYNDLIN